MLIVITIAAAASLAVIAYSRLKEHSPEAGNASLRAVRELAAIVLVCSKAIEGVVDFLAGNARSAAGRTSWDAGTPYDSDLYEEPASPDHRNRPARCAWRARLHLGRPHHPAPRSRPRRTGSGCGSWALGVLKLNPEQRPRGTGALMARTGPPRWSCR